MISYDVTGGGGKPICIRERTFTGVERPDYRVIATVEPAEAERMAEDLQKAAAASREWSKLVDAAALKKMKAEHAALGERIREMEAQTPKP